MHGLSRVKSSSRPGGSSLGMLIVDTSILISAGLFALNVAQYLHARYVAAPTLAAARTAEAWWKERAREAGARPPPLPRPVDKVTLCAPEFHAPLDSR